MTDAELLMMTKSNLQIAGFTWDAYLAQLIIAAQEAIATQGITLDLEQVSKLCADPDYKARIQFVASAKQPTLRLRLASGVDSLRQSKVFIQKYGNFCK